VEDRAIINRYGFNSEGMESVRSRLISYRSAHPTTPGLLGINLGKNKNTEVASDDYIKAMCALGEFGDYLVINISSPNTAGLRTLQGSSEMEQLITAIQAEKSRHESLRDKPLLVKIAPDLSHQELEDVARVSLRTNIEGLIVSNTTISRPSTLISKDSSQTGGLSGKPLKDRSLQVLKEIHALTEGKISIISVGGVETGEDAFQRLQAGASLVQVYSAMTFHGPGLASRINDQLDDILRKLNIDSVSQIREKSL
jgi:dihydroorotate dehydrogenase